MARKLNTTIAPPATSAPTVEDFAPAIEAQAQAIDQGVQKLVPPPSRYSGPNLRAWTSVVMKACSLLDGKTYEVPRVIGSEEAKAPVSIPLDVAKHYFALWQAFKAFAKKYPDEAADLKPLTPLEALAGDGELAVAGAALNALSKSREFKAFLKEPAPEPEEEQATDTGPEMDMEYAESPHKDELDALFTK
jgi:hypothetical protein